MQQVYFDEANQGSRYRHITYKSAGKHKIPLMATDHDVGHGRDIAWDLWSKEAPEHIKANWHGASWIAEVIATGKPQREAVQAYALVFTSLRTTQDALLQQVRERWHWIRLDPRGPARCDA